MKAFDLAELKRLKEQNDLLDNLGDAHEALEECFGMIWFLADRVAGMLHHDQAEPTRDQILDVIRQAQASYQDGLSRSESS